MNLKNYITTLLFLSLSGQSGNFNRLEIHSLNVLMIVLISSLSLCQSEQRKVVM